MSSHLKTLCKAAVSAAVDRLIAHATRTPYEHLPGYMHRYWLIKPSRWTLGMGVRLHHILRSDLDRDLHTHPWWCVSLILRGCYTEVMPASLDKGGLLGGYANLSEPWRYALRKPGHIVVRSRHSRHKLFLFRGTVWSLFIHGRDHGSWGYHVPGVGLVDRRDYDAHSSRKDRETAERSAS